MGYLNSDSVTVDAILTKHGRKLLANGQSLGITQLALSDDGVDYSLYNVDHPSGSAYYDLDILQTPVLAAFTENTSNLKSRLVTYTRLNLLYLPILKINEASTDFSRNTDANQAENKFVITVDEETSRNFKDAGGLSKGIMTTGNGTINGINSQGTLIRLDQGLDTVSPTPSP